MTNLFRELAPVSPAAWSEIEDEARRTLRLTLAGRKLVDFIGPLGADIGAIGTGRTTPIPATLHDGVEGHQYLSQPIIKLRVPFELVRHELETIERGSKDADLGPLTAAARALAVAENTAIFQDYAAGGIEGIGTVSEQSGLTFSDDYVLYPKVVAAALGKLRAAGVAGPYGIALGPRCYTGLTETSTAGGYPVYAHVRRLLDGPVVWAPGVPGAIVLSLRGGDFELTVGQDISIGYLRHTEESIRLYLQETFTFRVLTPEAAVPLSYASAAKA